MTRNSIALPSLIGLVLVCGSVGLLWSLSRQGNPAPGKGSPITLHCAAGLAKPVQRIAAQYEKETGRRVNLQFGGSGTLLSGLQVSKQGDLFLAADSGYIKKGRDLGLIEEVLPVATLTPVIAVKSGNPKGIKGLADFTRADVRIALADPASAAVGEVARKMFEEVGLWAEVEKAAQTRGVFQPTVSGLATDVSSGPIDAAIVWGAVADQFERVDSVTLESSDRFVSHVNIGVLGASRVPTAALHFARYLSASDRGLTIFKEEGFTPVAGDAWAEVPELTLFSGGVNRVAIEETLREFQQREGVRVNTVYNGCGILVSQMRSGANPDAYLACDTSYMDEVHARFRDHQLVSSTEMVIITAPGNPKKVTSLADLAKPGMKVATTNPEFSALGGLTHKLLKAVNLFDSVIANVTYGDAPTADAVVTRVRTAREDAGIVYRANTVGLGGDLEIIEIESPLASASQPVAVSLTTTHPHLMDRLVSALIDERSGARYRDAGFEFIPGKEWPKP